MSQLPAFAFPNASVLHYLANTKTANFTKIAQAESKNPPKKHKKQAKNAFFSLITEIFP